jgi:hypothetical protein
LIGHREVINQATLNSTFISATNVQTVGFQKHAKSLSLLLPFSPLFGCLFSLFLSLQ